MYKLGSKSKNLGDLCDCCKHKKYITIFLCLYDLKIFLEWEASLMELSDSKSDMGCTYYWYVFQVKCDDMNGASFANAL